VHCGLACLGLVHCGLAHLGRKDDLRGSSDIHIFVCLLELIHPLRYLSSI
jgi:hypothetical protein